MPRFTIRLSNCPHYESPCRTAPSAANFDPIQNLSPKFAQFGPAICTCTNVPKAPVIPARTRSFPNWLNAPNSRGCPSSRPPAHRLPATGHLLLPTTSTTNIPANISAPLHTLVAPTPHQPPTSENQRLFSPENFFKILAPALLPTLNFEPWSAPNLNALTSLSMLVPR